MLTFLFKLHHQQLQVCSINGGGMGGGGGGGGGGGMISYVPSITLTSPAYFLPCPLLCNGYNAIASYNNAVLLKTSRHIWCLTHNQHI